MDREKVIKGLECCMKWTGEPNTATCHCSDCSYTNMDILGQRCLIDLINDALALLKEQQQQIWELQDQVEYLTDKQKEQEAVYPSWQNGKMYCGHCGSKFPPRVGMRFCHRCGMPIKLKVNDIVEQEGR